MIRDIEQDDGVLIFDDTIQEKPYTDENDLICWHYDHSQNRTVKGINLHLFDLERFQGIPLSGTPYRIFLWPFTTFIINKGLIRCTTGL